MNKHPFIGIMVPRRSIRKRALRLYRAQRRLRPLLYAFTPADIDWRRGRVTGLRRLAGKWKAGVFPLPKAIYNRCYRPNDQVLKVLAAAKGRAGCFNTVNQLNKRHVGEWLSQSDLHPHMPETGQYRADRVTAMLERHKLLYCKPAYGHKGRMAYRLERVADRCTYLSQHSVQPMQICRSDEQLISKLETLLQGQEYVLQQGIRLSQSQNRRYDIRSLLQKTGRGRWAVSAVICRVAHDRYYNTSMYQKICDAGVMLGSLFPEESSRLLQDVRRISLRAAQIIESHAGLMGELGVDLGLDGQGRLWIIEVNGQPDKSLYKELGCPKLVRRIYSRPLEYASYLCRPGK